MKDAKRKWWRVAMSIVLATSFVVRVQAISTARLGSCDAGSSTCCGGFPEAKCDGGTLSGAAFVCLRPSVQILATESRVTKALVGTLCARSNLDRPVQWTTSGIWNGSDLILADTVWRGLRRYSIDGKLKPEMLGPLSRNWADLYPVKVENGENGFVVVQLEGNRFIELDRNYRFLRSVDALSLVGPNGATLEKIYDWSLAGRDIVAFADVKTPNKLGDRWSCGIVRFHLEQSSRFKFLKSLSTDDVSRKFHRMGYAYLAAIGGTAYVILMEPSVHLLKNEEAQGNLKELVSLSADSNWLRKVSVLPNFIQPGDYAPLMRAVEDSTLPAGIYSWEGDLYLLSRSPLGVGTKWLLSKIDPVKEQILGTVEIPSHANHLFVVPGPQYWAFVEKGPALGLKDQAVQGVLTIKSKDMATAFSVRSQHGNAGLAGMCQ
jgi:hypothetical protein